MQWESEGLSCSPSAALIESSSASLTKRILASAGCGKRDRSRSQQSRAVEGALAASCSAVVRAGVLKALSEGALIHISESACGQRPRCTGAHVPIPRKSLDSPGHGHGRAPRALGHSCKYQRTHFNCRLTLPVPQRRRTAPAAPKHCSLSAGSR